jgi:hypothetical protein
MESTVGAQTGLVETRIIGLQADGGLVQQGDGADKGLCLLERLDVKDWKVYQALGLEFDHAMARHVASIVQQIISFAKKQGKPLGELSTAEVAELQQLVVSETHAEGSEASAGQQIRELIARVCAGASEGPEVTEEEERHLDDDDESMLVAAVFEAVAAGHDVDTAGTVASFDGKDDEESYSEVRALPMENAEAAEDTRNNSSEDPLPDASLDGNDDDEEVDAVTRLPEDLIIKMVEDGIDIKNVRKLVFSTWDYGGQHVFRIVHHLFLTRFAVYLAVFNMDDLVGDSSSEETQEKCLTELHSWLNGKHFLF